MILVLAAAAPASAAAAAPASAADRRCAATCQGLVENGSWWARYDADIRTDWSTAGDMAARRSG
jgi:hypothetical protein